MLRFKQTAHFQKHIFSKKKLAKYKSLAFSRCLFRRNCLKVRAFSWRHHLPLSVSTLPEKPLGRELIHEIVCALVGFCYLGCPGEFCFNLLDLPLEVNFFVLLDSAEKATSSSSALVLRLFEPTFNRWYPRPLVAIQVHKRMSKSSEVEPKSTYKTLASMPQRLRPPWGPCLSGDSASPPVYCFSLEFFPRSTWRTHVRRLSRSR